MAVSSQNCMSLQCKDPSAYVTTQDQYLKWRNDNMMMSKTGTIPRNPQQQQQHQPFGNHRLTRKLSTDSLLDYRTYQMDDASAYDVLLGNQHLRQTGVDALTAKTSFLLGGNQNLSNNFLRTTAGSVGGGGGTVQTNGGSSAYLPGSTMTLSRAQLQSNKTSMKTSSSSTGFITAPGSSSSSTAASAAAAAAVKGRNLQLSRMPLRIQTETFAPYPPADREPPTGGGGGENDGSGGGSGGGIDGLLLVHIFCGHGLKSSRTALRDLYCVVEVDAVNKARTMIRTGAINFDWDEAFDVDLEAARKLSFLVYSWDPHTRHRLCFTGSVQIVALVGGGRGGGGGGSDDERLRLAVRLEPKGILYVELSYRELAVALQRRPSMLRNAVFGVDLKELVVRERSVINVPVLVQRCVEEVERRGLDHVGIYRLCGSARRKKQLRDEFERNAQTADISVEAVSDVNVITSKS